MGCILISPCVISNSSLYSAGVRNLLIDHLCDADLLAHRSHVANVRHWCNANADNEEIVKATLLIGLSDRVCRVQKGRIVKGAIKPDEIIITNE